jgi:hypothetical protein
MTGTLNSAVLMGSRKGRSSSITAIMPGSTSLSIPTGHRSPAMTATSWGRTATEWRCSPLPHPVLPATPIPSVGMDPPVRTEASNFYRSPHWTARHYPKMEKTSEPGQQLDPTFPEDGV